MIAIAAGVAGSSTACLDHDLVDATASEAPFIALQRDFSGYRDWVTFDLGVRAHAGLEGATRVYCNRIPPPGLSRFPNGTIIVKTLEGGEPSTWPVHAMVKRGGGFNAQGAFEWEFFDLQLSAGGVPVIVWRGEGPPSGHQYQVTPGTDAAAEGVDDCSGCHKTETNDAVLTEDLDLDVL
ncbi:MAG: hypothetical protein IPK13_10605 [Deltaproteobacteria bacterium]|nr:hypothetical protein [Deltaproteobacteria bacterium]